MWNQNTPCYTKLHNEKLGPWHQGSALWEREGLGRGMHELNKEWDWRCTHTGGGTSSTWEDCYNSRPGWYTRWIPGQPELTITQERGGRKKGGREGKKGEGTGKEDQKQQEVGDTPYNPNTQTQIGNSRAQGPVCLNHTVSFKSTWAT